MDKSQWIHIFSLSHILFPAPFLPPPSFPSSLPPSSDPSSFCLKISAFPKTMELQIGAVLLNAGSSSGCRLEENELSPSASHATHILHVVHSPGK